MEIYAKGAPEVMADICERDSCVFPESFGMTFLLLTT